MLRQVSTALLRNGSSNACQLASSCEMQIAAGCRQFATAASPTQSHAASCGGEQHVDVTAERRTDLSEGNTAHFSGREGVSSSAQQELERFRTDNQSMPYLQGQVRHGHDRCMQCVQSEDWMAAASHRLCSSPSHKLIGGLKSKNK